MAPMPDTQAVKAMWKGRMGQKHSTTSSADSIGSNDDTEEKESGGLKASVEGAIDKLKEKTHRRSNDSSRRDSVDSVSTRKLSNLIPGSKRRKNKKREREMQDQEGNDASPIISRSTTAFDTQNPSQDSLANEKSGASSLLTEDSDGAESPITGLTHQRPTLSPRESHIGYLTLSSPSIASNAITSQVVAEELEEHSTIPITSQSTPILPEDIASNHAATFGNFSNRSSSNLGQSREEGGPSTISKSEGLGGTHDIAQFDASDSAGADGRALGDGSEGHRAFNSQSSEQSRHATDQKVHASPEQPKTPRGIESRTPVTPPNAGIAPVTMVTPPTPTDARTPFASVENSSSSSTVTPVSHKVSLSSPNLVTSPSGSMISHRRIRSANLPSKLSSGMHAPALTPHLEETKTPGGSLTSPSGSAGFFSSVFSAVQSTAAQFTNSISNPSNTSGQRSRSATASSAPERIGHAGGEEVIVPGNSSTANEESPSEPRQLAVHTLGSGDLSLSHLGISESNGDPSPPISQAVPQGPTTLRTDEASARAENASASRAVSMAYSEKAPADKPTTAASDINKSSSRPKSIASTPGDVTPPRSSVVDVDSSSIKRSGSVRSRLSGRRRRHRGSSVATTGTATGLGASTLTVNHGGPKTEGQKSTGFAVANSKRNKDFHQLFRSVPEDDYLIEDYSAALQRDILLHGRLYISEGHICFSSNILGWVTNLVISFDEVVSVEKKSTAVIFPNAIVVQTLHARNVFASLVGRESTYDVLIGVWRISHPNLKSSINGVQIDDSGTGDRTEKADSSSQLSGSQEGSDEEVYDEDEENEDMGSFNEAGAGSPAGSEAGDTKELSRKASGANGVATKGSESPQRSKTDFPGPATHSPTQCGDQESHYPTQLVDAVIPGAPLGKVYSLAFGPESGVFMRKWLTDDQKSLDVQMEDDKKGLGEDKKQLSYTFVKPLNAPIGPKQTKCIVTQTLESFDPDKAVTVDCSTATPDVPSGSVFTTRTRYCLMWGPDNSTRMIATCTVEWTGKSWLKGPIEKGCNDGQLQYAKDLVAALRAATASTTAGRGATRKSKSKRRKDQSDRSSTMPGPDVTGGARLQREQQSWGLLESLLKPLRPVTDILAPLMNTTVIMGILLVIVTFLWIRQSRAISANTGMSFPGPSSSQRFAAYEEIWRREEGDLWTWLEERVALDALARPRPQIQTERQQLVETRNMYQKLNDNKMEERQVDEAIKVTEERLEALKAAVSRTKERHSKPHLEQQMPKGQNMD